MANVQAIQQPEKDRDSKPKEYALLSLLVHILHETTIEAIHTFEDISYKEFTSKFYTLFKIKKRESASKIMRKIVEENEPNKAQLETLSMLEGIRSWIEMSFPQDSSQISKFINSSTSIASLNQFSDQLKQLLYNGFYLPANFNDFEQFGGLFVLIDILTTNYERYFEVPNEAFVNFRKVSILLIERLIYHVTDVKKMFHFRPRLICYLADEYQRNLESDNILIKNAIVDSFHSLGIYDKLNTPDYFGSGIIEYLLENVKKCHSAKDENSKIELVSNLEALLALVENNAYGVYGFLTTDGSMDLLIDLLDDRLPASNFVLNVHFTRYVDWWNNKRKIYLNIPSYVQNSIVESLEDKECLSNCFKSVTILSRLWVIFSIFYLSALALLFFCNQVLKTFFESPSTIIILFMVQIYGFIVLHTPEYIQSIWKQQFIQNFYYYKALYKLSNNGNNRDKCLQQNCNRIQTFGSWIYTILFIIYLLFDCYQILTRSEYRFRYNVLFNTSGYSIKNELGFRLICTIIFCKIWADPASSRRVFLAGRILQELMPYLYIEDYEEALERFRERDVCALMVDNLYSGSETKTDSSIRVLYELVSLKDEFPDNAVEIARLRELGGHQALQLLLDNHDGDIENDIREIRDCIAT